MPRFEYQFESRIDNPERRFKRRLRFVALLLLVLAVTAAVIYFIVPHKKDKDGGQDENTPAQVAEADEKNTQTDVAASDDKKVKTPGAPTSGDKKDTTQNENAQKGENAEQGRQGDSASTDSASEITAAPEKGKVWAGDPVNDAPQQVENKAQNNTLDELKQLFDKRDCHKLAAKSLEVINSENEGSENWRIAAKYLLEARLMQLTSNIGVPGISKRYSVRGGDTLTRIANRSKTTITCLMKYNRLQNGFIRIGKKLMVHPGPWKITVSKNNRLLKLYNTSNSEQLFAVFEIGVGRMNSTPAGEFVICSRIKAPQWTAPDGSVYEHGDPGNELGDYFLKLAAVGKPHRPLAGYGIHGTPNESTVGKSLSSGCIRMRNADVGLLFELVPEKTPVTITE